MSKPIDNWKSGSGHHLDELLRNVLRYSDGSIDFTFVHYNVSDNPLYKQVNELIIPRNPFQASRILEKQHFDIIHYSPLSVFAPIWGVHAKKTATVHGIEQVLYPEGYSPLHRFHDNVIQPAYMRHMDGIATVSRTGMDYFAEHYHIPHKKMFITTNGLSAAYRVLTEAELLSLELPVPEGRFVLHISNFSMRKNPVAIMDGFAKFSVTPEGQGFSLVCAGKGWNGEQALRFAAEAGIGDKYVAPGFISESIAVGLLNRAAAFVFPSFAEGFGMPNVEAMACGCPVITSGIFAIPEIVGDAAIIISHPESSGEIASALVKIASDEGYKKTLVERGLRQSRLYRWEDSARAILAYWKELF
jgi:glycosyltransferase involved in cell wall biosynthesis